MGEDRQALDFSRRPEVTCATNVFEDVPVILRYDDEVLIEIVMMPDGSYTTSFVIYEGSGTKLAVVQGTQIFPTADGSSAAIRLNAREDRTVCSHGRQVLFDIERSGPMSLRLTAELHTPDGRLIVSPHDALPTLLDCGQPVPLRGVMMRANRFTAIPVALDVRSDGSITIGGVG